MGAESLQLIQLPSQAVGLSAPAPPIVPIQSTLCPIGGGGRTLGAHAAPPPPTSEENEGEEDSKDDGVVDRRVVGNHQNGTCVLMLSWPGWMCVCVLSRLIRAERQQFVRSAWCAQIPLQRTILRGLTETALFHVQHLGRSPNYTLCRCDTKLWACARAEWHCVRLFIKIWHIYSESYGGRQGHKEQMQQGKEREHFA